MPSHQTISKSLRILSQIFLILTPIMVILSWSNNNFHQFFSVVNWEIDINALPLDSKIYAILISLIPSSLWMAALYYLSKLFKHFEDNKLFSVANVYYLKKVGLFLFLEAIISLLTVPALSIITTMHNGVGNRELRLAISTNDIYNIAVAGVVMICAWVMYEGFKLKQEHDYTV
jgi:uncharacterized membrane protein